MFTIFPLTSKLRRKIKKYNLEKKLTKATILLVDNPHHPSLHTELLEPHANHIHSFRLDRKFRAIFIIHPESKIIQIINITVHYH